MPANSSISSSNQRFFAWFLGLILVVAALDWGVGKALEAGYFAQTTGKFYRTTIAIDRTRADVVVFGSSRAIHHYDPRILAPKLGHEVYNTGAKGQDILYAYGVLHAILHRYTPRLVILNLDTRLYNLDGKFDRLSDFEPFYRTHPELQDLIARKGKFETVKLLSYTYTFNSTFLHLINYALAPQPDFHGFLPLTDVLVDPTVATATAPSPTSTSFEVQPLDSDYRHYTQAFIEEALKAGCKVLIVQSPGSPFPMPHETESISSAKALALQLGVPVWDYSNDKQFVGHADMFNDYGHLNVAGASVFSSELADRILAELPFETKKP